MNPRRPTSFTLRPSATLITLALLALAGCATPRGLPGSPAPADLVIKLRVMTTDNRLMRFELAPVPRGAPGDAPGGGSQLSYAGGHDAITGALEPVCKLTPQQKQAAWDIVTRNHLLDAKGVGIFTKGEKVTYEFSVHAGNATHAIRAIDDEVPGLKDLQELLFKDQAATRYDNLPGLSPSH